jgi:hypothetical protein
MSSCSEARIVCRVPYSHSRVSVATCGGGGGSVSGRGGVRGQSEREGVKWRVGVVMQTAGHSQRHSRPAACTDIDMWSVKTALLCPCSMACCSLFMPRLTASAYVRHTCSMPPCL